MTEDEKAKRQAEYQRKYENKRVVKKVSFNLEKEKELLDFIETEADDFSNWIKSLIRAQMK